MVNKILTRLERLERQNRKVICRCFEGSPRQVPEFEGGDADIVVTAFLGERPREQREGFQEFKTSAGTFLVNLGEEPKDFLP
jgi:hypothetical protein